MEKMIDKKMNSRGHTHEWEKLKAVSHFQINLLHFQKKSTLSTDPL